MAILPAMQVGEELSAAGDMDADGCTDGVLTVHPLYVRCEGEAGETVVLSGRDGRVLRRREGRVPEERFRSFVDGAIDADGDGVRDVIAGCPDWGESAGSGREGAHGTIRVYSGRTGAPMAVLAGEPGDMAVGWFGCGVQSASAGRNGVIALVATVPAGPAGSGRGVVRLHPSMGGALLRTIEEPGWEPGSCMATGDLDGDGVNDLAIAWSAPGLTRREESLFRVTAVSTKSGRTLWTVAGTCPRGQLGSRMAAGGDFDGDGVSDIVLLEPRALPQPTGNGPGITAGSPPSVKGRIAAHSGRDGHLLWQVPGLRADFISFWWDVAVVGDADGDGIPDVCAGAPGFAPGDEDPIHAPGAVFLLSGRDGRIVRRIDGRRVGEGFGKRLAALPSIGESGVPGILVSAPGLFLPEGWTGGRMVGLTLAGEQEFEWPRSAGTDPK